MSIAAGDDLRSEIVDAHGVISGFVCSNKNGCALWTGEPIPEQIIIAHPLVCEWALPRGNRLEDDGVTGNRSLICRFNAYSRGRIPGSSHADSGGGKARLIGHFALVCQIVSVGKYANIIESLRRGCGDRYASAEVVI